VPVVTILFVPEGKWGRPWWMFTETKGNWAEWRFRVLGYSPQIHRR
jgi:hypothetical protein